MPRRYKDDPLERVVGTDVICRLVRETTEVCELGCEHTVGWWAVKRIYLAPVEYYKKWINALHYDKGGVVEIQVAYDKQGRRYERRPSWDGYQLWQYVDGDEDNNAYWNRLWRHFDVQRDLTGRHINKHMAKEAA